jgi:hypothetical protein
VEPRAQVTAKWGAGIAPHIAQIAEVWIEIEGGIGYVWGGMTFLRIVIPLYLFV